MKQNAHTVFVTSGMSRNTKACSGSNIKYIHVHRYGNLH